ncbi:MAG: Vitamin B12 transporter BtuB [Chromatiales bacterium USCg_Taylor]|nr:MAG: Vitamin B12 transporter BtuB [Chromatiales bacterium USCg_Taylor]
MLLRRMPAVLLPLCCYSSYAAEEPIELSPIIVTATRTAQTADETLASVTVITRAEIERRQATSVQEVLRGVPGVGIANSGGLGQPAGVFLRGTESDQVLVLVDGLRTGSVSAGTTAFESIPIDEIERIEIVRGPRSSLYGSEAIGGVIQIFTRKGGGGLRPSFSAGGGSHATYKLSGGLSGGGERGSFNLSASRLDTASFNACSSTVAQPGGCFTFEPDDDGYTNNAGSARFGYRFENGLEVDAHLLHAEGANEFDRTDDFNAVPSEFFHNRSDYLQQTVGGKLRFSPLEPWLVTITGGRNLDELDSVNNPASTDVFDSQRQSALLQNDITLAPDHLLTVGFDYYKDLLESNLVFAETSRDNKAGFAQYQGAFNSLDWILGVRQDDNQRFGNETTGNVTLGYSFGPLLRLTAGWGRGFKAPTFNELYFPGFGDPNLDPERSESVEVGANGTVVGVRWSLNGYYTKLDELIGFISVPVNPEFPFGIRAANVEEARILGLEAVASTQILGWDIAANLSLIDPEVRGEGPNKGNVLPRRAEQMFRFDLDRRFGRFSFGATVYGEGRRFDDLENTRRLAGFVLVDLRAGVEIYKGLFLEGKVGNLLDKEYETADFFNQDDTNLFVTLRYQPDAL